MTRRGITYRAGHLVILVPNPDARPDSVPISPYPHQSQLDPVTRRADILPDLGSFAQAGDHHVDASIAVQIRIRAAPVRPRRVLPSRRQSIGECSVPLVEKDPV